MTAQPTRLSGEEWERWANKLLTCHYGPTEYQKVPSNHKGDAGIEGFTFTDGHAYQAYGCEEPVATQKRYEAQRKKMSDDITKFIKNKAVLAKIFKAVAIKRWVLFVPYHDSKDLVAHAATKTAEVIAANLPYVAADFRVVICQEDDFPIARQQLLGAHVGILQIKVNGAAAGHVKNWISQNSALFSTLEEKIGRLPAFKNAVQRQGFCENVLKWHIDGQVLLDELRRYPEIYEKVSAAKNHQENYLAISALDGGAGGKSLIGPIQNLKDALQREVGELHSFNSEALAYEAVADWLLRCPLNFPEVI